ncbi:MAG: NADH-quinone oxidoreductase subunit L, partial [Thiothrix sp.]|nr:NADH-quinone oxidoreductase subunit L [Thiothrix sp.]
ERMDDHTLSHLHESPKVVTIPLILLAIPAVLAGYLVGPMVYGDFFRQLLPSDAVSVSSIMVHANHQTLPVEDFHGAFSLMLHGLLAPPFWLAMAGVGVAWYIYLRDDSWAERFRTRFSWLYRLLENKYYLDDFNQKVFANGALYLGNSFLTLIERLVIDGLIVNGLGRVVRWLAGWLRRFQTGYLYQYAFTMVLGMALLLGWLLFAVSA